MMVQKSSLRASMTLLLPNRIVRPEEKALTIPCRPPQGSFLDLADSDAASSSA